MKKGGIFQNKSGQNSGEASVMLFSVNTGGIIAGDEGRIRPWEGGGSSSY